MVWTIQILWGILIQRKFINSASVTVLSKHLTSRIGVSQTLGIFGLNPMSSLLTSWTSRFNWLLANYKPSLLSMYLVYVYGLIGFWNWRKCLGQLCHWHCEIQVPECRTSYLSKQLVEHTMLHHFSPRLPYSGGSWTSWLSPNLLSEGTGPNSSLNSTNYLENLTLPKSLNALSVHSRCRRIITSTSIWSSSLSTLLTPVRTMLRSIVNSTRGLLRGSRIISSILNNPEHSSSSRLML